MEEIRELNRKVNYLTPSIFPYSGRAKFQRQIPAGKPPSPGKFGIAQERKSL